MPSRLNCRPVATLLFAALAFAGTAPELDVDKVDPHKMLTDPFSYAFRTVEHLPADHLYQSRGACSNSPIPSVAEAQRWQSWIAARAESTPSRQHSRKIPA
jgi:hypothetical protein